MLAILSLFETQFSFVQWNDIRDPLTIQVADLLA